MTCTFVDFSNIMDLNVRPALQLSQALLAGHANSAIWTNRERHESGNPRAAFPLELRSCEERTRKFDPNNGR